MISRLFICLVLGFVLGTIGITLVPDLGRVAGPFVCDGVLEPEPRVHGLRYRCISAADGRVLPVPTDRVVFQTIPILTGALLLPVCLVLHRLEQHGRRLEQRIEADLATAVPAQAEVLRIAQHGNLKRQILMRAAELKLVLWVQPPNGRPYEAIVPWLVEEDGVGQLREGAILPVRINPLRPQFVYPAQPWAHFAWWLAAQPTAGR